MCKFAARLVLPQPVHVGDAEQHLIAGHDVRRVVTFKDIYRICEESKATADFNNLITSLLHSYFCHFASAACIELEQSVALYDKRRTGSNLPQRVYALTALQLRNGVEACVLTSAV